MTAETILAHVDAMASLTASLPFAFVKKYGFLMAGSGCKHEVMAPRQCYANSYAKTMEGLAYVEGFAMLEGLIPLPHAWNMEGIEVLDYTWGSSPTSSYYGVAFDYEFVDEFVARTKMVSIFESLYMLRMKPDQVLAYLESGLVKK